MSPFFYEILTILQCGMIHPILNLQSYLRITGLLYLLQGPSEPCCKNLRESCKMQTSTSKAVLAGALALSFALVTTQAFADCDEGQESMVGKAIAAAASAKIAPVVPTQTKQMINLETCDTAGANVTSEFKFNVIGSDGLYWVTGTAKISGGKVADMKFSGLSPNLAAASSKAGVKLASN